MSKFPDDHKGYTTFPHASGPHGGPWMASYAVFKIEENNNYRGVLQGTVTGELSNPDDAIAAAMHEAKLHIDTL